MGKKSNFAPSKIKNMGQHWPEQLIQIDPIKYFPNSLFIFYGQKSSFAPSKIKIVGQHWPEQPHLQARVKLFQKNKSKHNAPQDQW